MKTKVMSPPPPGDESDDNVQLGSPVPADSDEGEAIVSDHDSEHIPTSDSDDEEPRSLDKLFIDEEFDFDTAQHHREIVLEYFKKRDSIGIDAARVMSVHSHEPMDEWDQPEVPLEATLSSPHPKPPQSKFRSTVSQAYNTTLPSATPSTSLGGSVLPGASSTLQSAMRVGKLEGDKLVGGEEGESGEEDDDDVKEFMAALRKGEVTNAGAEQNAETLVAALMKAYTAPEKGEEAAKEALEDQSKVEAASQTQAKAPAPVPTLSKASKFKLNRFPATAPRSPSDLSDSDPTPISNSARSSPKLPTSNTQATIEIFTLIIPGRTWHEMSPLPVEKVLQFYPRLNQRRISRVIREAVGDDELEVVAEAVRVRILAILELSAHRRQIHRSLDDPSSLLLQGMTGTDCDGRRTAFFAAGAGGGQGARVAGFLTTGAGFG
ncbi:hypothetical protein EWM64_g7192 [Hericium alpestre]|uniref:Uncharacterized protein n=1 Tax=Hericium alpestre TaxID=135208 RepID=A0A4Y9ZPW1_9AGAM|nr:hypothetical protein EWM64_g7192 [Hericium alpestre]